jgi:hypothetical protein
VAAQCPAGCTECLAQDYCTACQPVPYYLSEHQCKLPNSNNCAPRQYQYNGDCLPCPYDCYTCNAAQVCISCHAETDFREYSNYRCVPLPGYYESGVTAAAACPTGCSSCYSATYCTACVAGYQLNNNAECLLKHVSAAAGCPQNCAACDPATRVCSSCISGYELAGQDCLSAEGSGTGSMVSIIVGATAAIVVLGIVVIVSYRRYNAKQLTESGVAVGMDSDLRLDHDKSVSTAHWRPRSILGTSVQDCAVCQIPTTLFMTACGHVLHPECLLKWGKEHEGCPSCQQPLREKEHFLFCRVCEEQEQVVGYERMAEILRGKLTTKETICASCNGKERET